MNLHQESYCYIYGCSNIISHMKTTIDITDSLLLDAKNTASNENITLREIIETSLRKYLSEKKAISNFELKKKSIGGLGLQAGASLDWNTLADQVYG